MKTKPKPRMNPVRKVTIRFPDEKIWERIDAGRTTEQAAADLGCSRSTVDHAMMRRRAAAKAASHVPIK